MVTKENPVCVKVKGAEKVSTIVEVEVDGDLFRFIQDPFDVTDKGLASLMKGYPISKYKESIQKRGPLPLSYGKENTDERILVLTLLDANPDKNTLTIQVGPTMESFPCNDKVSEK